MIGNVPAAAGSGDGKSFHGSYDFREQDIEVCAAVDLLRRRKRFAFPDRHMQMPVADLAGRAVQMLHRFFKGL